MIRVERETVSCPLGIHDSRRGEGRSGARSGPSHGQAEGQSVTHKRPSQICKAGRGLALKDMHWVHWAGDCLATPFDVLDFGGRRIGRDGRPVGREQHDTCIDVGQPLSQKPYACVPTALLRAKSSRGRSSSCGAVEIGCGVNAGPRAKSGTACAQDSSERHERGFIFSGRLSSRSVPLQRTHDP